MLGRRLDFKVSFIPKQIISVNGMSTWDVNFNNIYKLLKLKLMTTLNIDGGDASDTDTAAIRGNREIPFWS